MALISRVLFAGYPPESGAAGRVAGGHPAAPRHPRQRVVRGRCDDQRAASSQPAATAAPAARLATTASHDQHAYASPAATTGRAVEKSCVLASCFCLKAESLKATCWSLLIEIKNIVKQDSFVPAAALHAWPATTSCD